MNGNLRFANFDPRHSRPRYSLGQSWAGTALLLLAISLVGCKQSSPTSNLPTVPMAVGSKTFTLEIAAREVDREKGLMHRDAMPDDHGMVFVFTDSEVRKFWMHETRIPLDILYLDAGGRVVSIHRMEPYMEKTTVSKAPARYAIELNAGQAQASGVKEGDQLQLPEKVTNAPADP